MATLLRDAREEITAVAGLPRAHWRTVWSADPPERLDEEVERRSDVGGILPDDTASARHLPAPSDAMRWRSPRP